MDETKQIVKSEGGERLHCRVCDTRNLCINPDYFCSKNCEALFVLVQGIALGSLLQSLFKDLIKVQDHPDGNQENQKSSNLLDVQEFVDAKVGLSFERKTTENCMTGSNEEESRPIGPHNLMCIIPVHNSVAIEPKGVPDNVTWHSNRSKNKPVRATAGGQHKLQHDSRTQNASTLHKESASSAQKVVSKRRRLPVRFDSADGSVNFSRTGSDHFDAPVREGINSAQQGQAISGCRSDCYIGNDVTNTAKHTVRKVECKQCGQMINKSFLYVHYRAKHKDSLQDISDFCMSCSECGKLFMRKQALNTHKLKRHNHKFANNCCHCGKGFASRFGLSWHMRQVHKITDRQCGTCGEMFENRREYKKHRRYKHSTNSHVCHICGKGFKLKNALQAHLDAHAGVKLHFCEICGDGFVRFSSLCQHKNNLHGPKKSELPFRCHLCPNTFRLQTWLDKHILQKHQSSGRENDKDCKFCQDPVELSNVCPLHGKVAQERFSCPQCDKVFAKETGLKAHMKQHQEPKFSCDVCHKKFTYKCNMLRHRDTHSAEKMFHCDTCAKQFCTKFLLASHMRMHNEDLLFKCEFCGKGLTRKDYLKNHVMKMHPEHTRK